MNLAFHRMNDVGAVTATMDDETDELNVDVSNLIGGAALTINWLVLLAAKLSGGKLTAHDVIVELREYLDEE